MTDRKRSDVLLLCVDEIIRCGCLDIPGKLSLMCLASFTDAHRHVQP